MTSQHTVDVEVLTGSGCGYCQKAMALVREVIDELGDNRVHYREVNVVDEIDYAVQLGVLRAPAIALNGELVFPAPPSKAKLRQTILKRLAGSP
ncbi:MAG: thioredoxin family protein [Woeseia sp.]